MNMIKTNRKKLLLEKHNRLTPIDDALLKSKQKLQEIENDPKQEENQATLPLALKNKKPFEMPAIDHQKQKEKLQLILEKVNKNNAQYPGTSKSQLFPGGFGSVALQNKSNLVTTEDQKINDRKRKKVMSHQNNKASQSEERKQEQQNTDSTQIENTQKVIARGAKSSIRAVQQKTKQKDSNYNTNEEKKAQKPVKPKQTDKKPQTASSAMGRTQSKWLKEVARQNFIYLIEKIQDHENKKKVKVLTQVRERLKQRFMLLYKVFRHYKYQEPVHEITTREEIDQLEQKKKEIKTKQKLDDFLNTVEEEESGDEKEHSDVLTFKDPQQLTQYIRDYMLESIIYEFVLIHSDDVVKIKSFLQMAVCRNRYLKQRQSVSIIQRNLRVYLAKQVVEKLRQELKDEAYKEKLKQHIKAEHDKNKIYNAAIKIQSLYHLLKYKKELKEIRQKLKTLPYVCRSSFVKMQELKLSTSKLAFDLTSKLKK